MLEKNDSAEEKLHASTRVLTAGFDPHLSVGSARPAVFRSSTYVFSTPEAAERAFHITAGRARTSACQRERLRRHAAPVPEGRCVCKDGVT
jgi:cystathionine beta-lyase/cystathionine gamma-synthase